jgi:adenosylcobyric acid synthase
MGVTRVSEDLLPLIDVHTRNSRPADDTDGVRTADGRLWGTYLHGLFDETDFRRAFLRQLCPHLADHVPAETAETLAAFRDRQYTLLAEHFRQHLDTTRLWEIVGISGPVHST